MAQIDSSAKDFKHLSISEDLKGRKILDDAKYDAKDYGLHYPNDGQNYQKKPLGLALFGLGQIGTMHFHNLIKMADVDLLYVVEYDQSRLNYVSFKYNLKAKKLSSDQDDQVFNDPEVDVVVICTPTGTHEGLVTRALKAGKAVFCEKPLALSTDGVVSEVKPGEEKPLSYNHAGIKNCYDLAKKAGKPLFCAFNRRFDPALAEIKERVDKGEIGDIHVVKSCARDSPKPRVENLKTSGGIYHDCIVHDIDLICWVMGSYPTSVSSVAHSFDPKIAEINDFDTVAVTMKFPSGALGVIDISRYSVYGYDQRLEVFGNKGMLTTEPIRPTTVQFHNEIGSRQNPICFSFASRYPDSYRFEMEHFLEEVKGNRKSMNSGENVLAVSKIASSCERSAKEGRTVNISWD